MQLFKVIAKRNYPNGVEGSESKGFPSRAQAASFARGLAESGRCDSADVEPYEAEPDLEPTPRAQKSSEPQYSEEQVRSACADAGMGGAVIAKMVLFLREFAK